MAVMRSQGVAADCVRPVDLDLAPGHRLAVTGPSSADVTAVRTCQSPGDRESEAEPGRVRYAVAEGHLPVRVGGEAGIAAGLLDKRPAHFILRHLDLGLVAAQ